jgi:hypothetical protein
MDKDAQYEKHYNKYNDIPDNEQSKEVKKLINVDEKKWNIHMLRVCVKCLSELPKKDFKLKRTIASRCNNAKLEKKILEHMLCIKASNISSENFATFYKRLTEFESKKHLHPRRKYIDY